VGDRLRPWSLISETGYPNIETGKSNTPDHRRWAARTSRSARPWTGPAWADPGLGRPDTGSRRIAGTSGSPGNRVFCAGPAPYL